MVSNSFNREEDDSNKITNQEEYDQKQFLPIPKYLHHLDSMSDDFIFLLTLRGIFLSVSQNAGIRLLEYEEKDLIGHKISEFVHPSDEVALMRDLRNCSNEGSVNFICRVKRKNSGYFYMEMNAKVFNG